jgi:hypothetical protein
MSGFSTILTATKEELDCGLRLAYSNYETIETGITLDEYDAYDDKGNKIESEYIKLIKKEYDKKNN